MLSTPPRNSCHSCTARPSIPAPPQQAILPAYYMPALMEHAIGVDTTDYDDVSGKAVPPTCGSARGHPPRLLPPPGLARRAPGWTSRSVIRACCGDGGCLEGVFVHMCITDYRISTVTVLSCEQCFALFHVSPFLCCCWGPRL